ncbi:ScbA/BarX family gamma-butyrolactone biosynthesis protein [Streptomyces griseicoloratus]|uniref:ScbA/BarX family gamma-butyrolactone biosynthesis protein n=1 Tax=Streptomyces griseicoloratus TaxID=2752516 RepID=UPI001CB73A5E|nr:ScbA/BarX family gamma-butyrolactone biosynthesis protein [Streptomyces griseicoloratus]
MPRPAVATRPQTRTGLPVPLELVHRTQPGDAFADSWTRTDENRFSVTARLPHDHPFFAPVHGDRHDPLLLMETMRQSAMLVFHAGYGVPVGHHFLMSGLDHVCYPEHLGAGGEPAELDIETICSDLAWRGTSLVRGRVDWLVRRDGRLVATGTGLTRFIAPSVYRRMRGEHAQPRAWRATSRPLPTALAGRTRTEDVLLSSTPHDNLWELRVDTSHGTLFQGPKDHVPGMLLLEAARQAACAATAGERFVPTAGVTRFDRYAEFDRPCWIRATVLTDTRPGTTTVRVTGQQDAESVFTATLSGTVPAP